MVEFSKTRIVYYTVTKQTPQSLEMSHTSNLIKKVLERHI